MEKFDFNSYDDINLCHRFDGFIAPDGSYYKVKPKNSKDMFIDSHNTWAQKYITEKLKVSELKIRTTHSMLFGLNQINGPAEILIHYFGYVYYSHDPIYYKPIIKLPDNKIAGYNVTEEQLDTLFQIMILNDEKPYDSDIFFDNNINDYSGLDQEIHNIK